MVNYYYFEVELELRDEIDAVLTPAYFQGSIIKSLDGLFGEIGGQTDLELVKFDRIHKRALLKQIPCRFQILNTFRELDL